MKEDILEQLTDDYLQHLGYFTQCNIKFKPCTKHLDFESKQDSNHSDIDVLGINPLKTGPERVLAVSCKSWQGGFTPLKRIKLIEQDGIVSGRKAWRAFRELVKPKWAEAFARVVRERTGSEDFTYVTAVTKLRGDRKVWEQHQPFLDVIGSPIRVITLAEMLEAVSHGMSTTVASSDVGRTLQLIKASGWIMK